MNIYPNPVASILNVDFSLIKGDNVKIQLVDVLGKVAYSQSVNAFGGANSVKIDVKGLASGVYSLNILSGNEITSGKVVVR